MTIDELMRLASNPDTAPEALSELRTLYETQVSTIEGLNNQVSELNSRISTLQDTNMKLFLRTTSSVQSDEHEETPEEHEKWLKEEINNGIN